MTTALITLAAFWSVAVVTPGPNFFATVHRTVTRGRIHGLLVVAGIVTGTALWAVAGLFGLKALFALLPWTAVAIKTAGGLYLLWVGWTIWRAAGRDAIDHSGATARGSFLVGLATVLANPKTAAVASSLFAVALPLDATRADSAAALAVILVCPAIWYSIVVVGVSRPAMLAQYERVRRPMLRVTGALFVGFGARLVAER